MILDPDQILLSSNLNMTGVANRHGTAAKYALGKAWVKQWGHTFCKGKCQNLTHSDSDCSYGAPYVFTAADARRFAAEWTEVILELSASTREYGWMDDMYSAILAALRLGIHVDVREMMVSHPSSHGYEPWGQVSWDKEPVNQNPGEVWVAHYCQSYAVCNFTWQKHQLHEVDIQKCNLKNRIPSPDGPDQDLLFRMVQEKGSIADDESNMHAWMIHYAILPIIEAEDAYFKEFCNISTKKL